MAKPKKTRVIVMDDDQAVLAQVNNILKIMDIDDVYSTTDPEEGFLFLRNMTFDLAIIDLRMPNCGGLNIIQKIRAESDRSIGQIPILAIYGVLTESEIQLLSEFELVHIIKKPFLDENFAKDVLESLSMGCIGSASNKHDWKDYDVFLKMVTNALLADQILLARKILESKLTAAPKSARLNILWAKVLFAEGSLAEAQQLVERVLVTNRDYLPALNLKIKTLVKAGEYEKAITTMELAQTLSPLNVQRLMGMGEIHLTYGRLKAAKERFEKALDICPSLEQAKIGLARTMIQGGFKDIGKEMMESLDDPSCVSSELNFRGVMLVKAGKIKAGIDMYDKAMSCLKDDHAMHSIIYNKALACFKGGNRTAAKAAINKCLLLNPTYEKALVLKEKIYSDKKFAVVEENNNGFVPLFSERQISLLMGHSHAGVDSSNLDRQTWNRDTEIMFHPIQEVMPQ